MHQATSTPAADTAPPAGSAANFRVKMGWAEVDPVPAFYELGFGSIEGVVSSRRLRLGSRETKIEGTKVWLGGSGKGTSTQSF